MSAATLSERLPASRLNPPRKYRFRIQGGVHTDVDMDPSKAKVCVPMQWEGVTLAGKTVDELRLKPGMPVPNHILEKCSPEELATLTISRPEKVYQTGEVIETYRDLHKAFDPPGMPPKFQPIGHDAPPERGEMWNPDAESLNQFVARMSAKHQLAGDIGADGLQLPAGEHGQRTNPIQAPQPTSANTANNGSKSPQKK